MNGQERQQQRILLGWALDMPPSRLSGYPLERGMEELREQLLELLQVGGAEQLAPDAASDEQLKKRLLRIERALAGVSFRAIAEEEGIAPGAVRDSIKDSLKRLRATGYRE